MAFTQSLQLEWVIEYPCYAPSGLEYDKVVTDEEQNVYLLGAAVTDFSPTLYGSAILTQKYDSTGALLWQSKFDNLFGDQFYDHAFLEQDAIAVAGQRGSLPGSDPDRAEIVCYNMETGNELWHTFIFDTVSVAADLVDIDLDEDGNIYAFGIFNDDMAFDSNKVFIAKVAPDNGEVLWAKIFPDEFIACEGKVLDDKIRVTGAKVVDEFGNKERFINDVDFEGNLIEGVILSDDISIGPGVFTPYFFFDKDGNYINFGHEIYKFGLNEDPIWSFDCSRDLPDMIGQARTATVDEEGNIYATGYLHDTTNSAYLTQTIKLSPEGELLWATAENFDEDAGWEGGLVIAVSDHHVFVCSLPQNGENGDFWDDYQLVLYSQEDGSIVYDTVIDVNIRDMSYYAHYDKGHFYLLGKSYDPESSEPEDYQYQIFKFSVEEPVSASEKEIKEYPVLIFPNPAKNAVTISQEHLIFDFAALLDSNGKHIFSIKIENREQAINLRSVPPGTYFLKMTGENNAEYSEKILVRK